VGSWLCHNEVRRNGIIDKIVDKILGSQYVKDGTSDADLKKVLAGTEVDDLTEFSRSIHSETEAILAVAREGRHSLAGSTLYTTTHPCHNCARHIVAAGRSKVAKHPKDLTLMPAQVAGIAFVLLLRQGSKPDGRATQGFGLQEPDHLGTC
jgi:deoxycytidylate deaminase